MTWSPQKANVYNTGAAHFPCPHVSCSPCSRAAAVATCGVQGGGGWGGVGAQLLRRNLFYVPDLFRSLNLVWVCVGPDLNCINIWNWERHGRWNIVPLRFTIDSLNRYWAEVKIFRSLWKIFPVFVPTPRCFVVTDSVSPWLESPSIIHPSSREMALVSWCPPNMVKKLALLAPCALLLSRKYF